MTVTTRKNPVLANPFYVGLQALGVLFVVTVLGWLVAGHGIDSEKLSENPAFPLWLDRNGPLIIGIEFVLMLVTGVLAMLTEDWFMADRASDPKTRVKEGRKPLSDN
jgi:hypothetical protein